MQSFLEYPRCLQMKRDRSKEEGDDLVVKSHAMRRVITLAERVSQVDTPILLTGESGSGKERVARFIHGRSNR